METDHYDGFAEAYARQNETGLFNAHYAQPAIIDLAGDVTGRSILDAGCGAGPLAAALRDRGAQVTGFDSSPAMVALAQRRLGTDTTVLVADLAEPLPFGTGSSTTWWCRWCCTTSRTGQALWRSCVGS